MGGIAIINAAAAASLAVTAIEGSLDIRVVGIIVLMYLFALIGFIDDYEKAIRKNNAGISPKQKLIMQFGFSIAFAVFAAFYSYANFGLVGGTEVWIPFIDKYVDFGIFYIPFEVFVLVAFSNSVNLTDGLDGLASGVTTLVSLFMVIAGTAFCFMG